MSVLTRNCAEVPGPADPRFQALENRIPPPLVALGIALAMGIVAWATPSLDVAIGSRLGAATFLGLFAGFIGGSAFAALRRARTTINPINLEAASSLVTTGVYGLTRNPMYVALLSLLAALAFGLANVSACAGPILFALFISRFQIVPEERVMLAKFGPAYVDYGRRVRRWL